MLACTNTCPTTRLLLKAKQKVNSQLLKLQTMNHRILVAKKTFSHLRTLHTRAPILRRSDLKNAKRIIIKFDNAVITREDECGIALGRLASIAEQTAQLHLSGNQPLIITSGAIAFGKQKLHQEASMSRSVRQTIITNNLNGKPESLAKPRACGAVGQSGLMSLYESMFAQYGLRTAQVLLTKPDLYHESSREILTSTLHELMQLNIIPIVNANDAVAPIPEKELESVGTISIKDNDSLAARLAVEINADLMLLLSDVDGIYTSPPGTDGSRLLSTYSPKTDSSGIIFGGTSDVGLSGMQSKVNAATWALDHGVNVVICNGATQHNITAIMDGRKIGTFFTSTPQQLNTPEHQAIQARSGSQALQSLQADRRADIIYKLADLLEERQQEIFAANQQDVSLAEERGIIGAAASKIKITPAKLKSLADGVRQIADESDSVLEQVTRHTRMAQDMDLVQVTVPIGVLMIIFESRPECLPQIAALAISSGNGLLLKGGSEASHSNAVLHSLVQEALEQHAPKETIALVSTSEDITHLLQLKDHVDLVINGGSKELVAKIQQVGTMIPVLGHNHGICHVYVDVDSDPRMALDVIRDAKCDYPATCHAMETLLLHKDLVKSPFFEELLEMFRNEDVYIYSGPRLNSMLNYGPPMAQSMKTEYRDLICAIEIVDDVDEAIKHINKHGSGHTDAIITWNDEIAETFLQKTDSAVVMRNASTRFSDGYRFGLGAEVCISTTPIHARGPVGVEGLLTTKWILRANGQTVHEFNTGNKKYVHEQLPLSQLASL